MIQFPHEIWYNILKRICGYIPNLSLYGNQKCHGHKTVETIVDMQCLIVGGLKTETYFALNGNTQHILHLEGE